MVFCNIVMQKKHRTLIRVTILILVDGFLQYRVRSNFVIKNKIVTILILVDGFLQCYKSDIITDTLEQSQSLF